MTISLEQLMAQQQHDVRYSYTPRDTMLYALAVGMGRDRFNEKELDFVFERRNSLKVVPSQAVTVARHNLIYECGLNVEKMLHGEQILTLHRPLPTDAELLGEHKVLNVIDKGPSKGILIETDSQVRLVSGEPLFGIYNLYFARGDGGMGSSGGVQRPAYDMPSREPDIVCMSQREGWQALLYRLTGDRNVIHGDPGVARAMGFQGPILHGSCTLGMACRDIVEHVCNYDAGRIRQLGTRFSGVFYPGERLKTEIWVDGNQISFRCHAPDRNALILDHGQCLLAPENP